jgi:hypothetical protein
MTDRELLVLAAKAYWDDEIDDVCSVEWSEADQAIAYTHADNQDHNGADQTFIWNPLADDGDALRLAVKLGIAVYPPDELGASATACNQGEHGRNWHVEIGSEPNAATRRAIVRAAAEVGQGMLTHNEFVLMFPGRFEAEEVERAAAEVGRSA